MTFDEYCMAVREADVGFVLTRPSSAPWRLDYVPLGHGSMQFGDEGGGNIVEGNVRSDAVILLIKRFASLAPISLDGHQIGDTDLMLLGPSSHFVFSSAKPRNWLAITLPAQFLAEQSSVGIEFLRYSKLIISSSTINVRKLLAQAESIRRFSQAQEDEGEHQGNYRYLVDFFVQQLALAQQTDRLHQIPKRSKANETVSVALEFIRKSDSLNICVAELCAELNLSERTLLRYFHRIVGMGPKKYLRYWQLNNVRRLLVGASPPFRSVTELMTDCGMTELGRVSGQYKDLFGEHPAETLNRTRSATRSGRQEAPETCNG